MSFAGGAFFTNKGKVLHAKAIAGADLVFTRLAMGDGELGSSQSISELTAMINQKLSVNITSLKALTGGVAAVKGSMNNQGLATGFYWREIGLFATDPNDGEILYCYGNAGALAEYIPAGSGSEILEKVIGIDAIVSDVANVSATINQSLIYASQDDLEDHIASRTNHVSYGVDSGTTDAYAVTLAPAPTAYTAGMMVIFKAATANTGAASLNCNSLGDVAIKKASIAGLIDLVTGDILANDIVCVIYNGTYWVAVGLGLGAHLADYAHSYAADSGSTDAYAITLDPAPSAYASGQRFLFKANTTNTGVCTLNVNSLGAKTIKKWTKTGKVDTDTYDIMAGQIVMVVYDGSDMVLLSRTNETGLVYYNAGAEYVPWISGYSNETCNRSKQSGYLLFESTTSNGRGEYVTDIVVDLRGLTKIKIDWELPQVGTASGTHAGFISLKTSDNKTSSTMAAQVNIVGVFSRRITEIDVTTLQGFYHIAAMCYRNMTGDGGTTQLKVYKVWGEK